MKIILWGVRGSVPAPLSNQEYQARLEKVLERAARQPQYLSNPESINSFLGDLPPELGRIVGGDTTCVEVSNEAGQRLILDCGTGLRRLGYQMMKEGYGEGDRDIHICLTHTHWDHIMAWQFFIPGYIAGNRVHFHSTIPNLRERMRRNQHPEHFPLEFEDMQSERHFHLLSKKPTEKVEINGFQVSCLPLRHPGGSTGYRVEADGKVFVFATDVEISGEDIMEYQRGEHGGFFKDADLLVMDAQYTLEEAFMKFDWGHSSASICVNLAVAQNIRKLVLTHHEPAYEDGKLEENLGYARTFARDLKAENLEIDLAREGNIYEL